jgi:hypothetical protein
VSIGTAWVGRDIIIGSTLLKSRWARVLTLLGAVMVLSFSGYLVALSTYDDKQRKFDSVYTEQFVDDSAQGREYKRVHDDFIKNVPALNLKESNLSQLSMVFFMNGETLERRYEQIHNCIIDRTCTPGWKQFWFCRTANQDWEMFKEIRRKAKDTGVTVATETPAPPNTLLIPNPVYLMYMLATVCNQNPY